MNVRLLKSIFVGEQAKGSSGGPGPPTPTHQTRFLEACQESSNAVSHAVGRSFETLLGQVMSSRVESDGVA